MIAPSLGSKRALKEKRVERRLFLQVDSDKRIVMIG